MKQPDLGIKVAELRQQKGMTQEQLAENCEVSARTIQRIESGEVDSRIDTIKRLGERLDYDFGSENAHNEEVWLAVLHLSSIIPLVVPPLLIWSWKKRQSYTIDKHGRDVLNFQITMLLVLLAASLFMFLVPILLIAVGAQWGVIHTRIGIMELLILTCPLPLILIGIFTTFQGVANTIRVLSDRPFRYLFSIPFLRD